METTVTFKQKKIIAVVLISLAIGLIYVYPDLRFIFESKDEFKGITLTAASDELGYLARVKAVYKGNLTSRGMDLYEYRNTLWTYPFLSELIEGSAGRLLNIDVVWLDILMSFLLPIILFWLICILVMRVSDSAACSLFAGAFILLGYGIFTGSPQILREIFILRSYPQPLLFLRPISPQFNHLVFMLSILMIYTSIIKKKLLYTFIAAISVGTLFYIHFHYWTFIYAGLGVLTLSFVIVKDKEALKVVFLLIAASLLISVPFWLHLHKLRLNPNYFNLLNIAGLIKTRIPILPVFHVALTIIIIATLRRLKDPNLLFLASFLIGGILCLNQQLITGITLVSGHWQGYTNKTFIMMALTVALFKVIKRLPQNCSIFASGRLKKGLFGCALLFLYFSAFMQQNSYYNAHKERFRKSQAIAGSYKWLKNNVKDTDVVLTDPNNYLIRKSPHRPEVLVYTNCYSYLPIGYTSLISKEEFEGRSIRALKFFKYPEIESYLTYAAGAYMIGVRALSMYGNEPVLATEVERLKERYAGLSSDIVKTVKKYKVDYAIIQRGDLGKYATELQKNKLKVIYQDENFSILKII